MNTQNKKQTLNFAIATLTALTLSALTITAQATSMATPDVRPAIDPIPSSELPVLVLEAGGGWPLPGAVSSRKLMVMRDGSVVVREIRPIDTATGRKAEETQYNLPNLSAEEMLLIGETEAQIHGGAFVKNNAPECMDAPGRTYEIYRSGKAIPFFKNMDCKDFPLKDARQVPAGNYLKAILDSLYSQTRR